MYNIHMAVQEGGLKFTGQTILEIGPIPITNSMIYTAFIEVLLLVLAIYIYKNVRFVPGRIQALLEATYEFIESIALTMLPKKIWDKMGWFFFIAFLYIIVSNYLGLMPGVETIKLHLGEKEISLIKPHNTDINHTLALGIFTLILVHGFVLLKKGPIKWVMHFFHTKPWIVLPIFIAIGLLELTLEPVKFFVLGLRLFGNITAGEILIASMLSLPAVAVPFMLFELLVGFLQAFVFVALSLTYLGLLIKEH